jgi:deoxyribose-phosphate aldolase
MQPAVALKVIIESAALTEEQIRFVCRIVQESGADFVKTSTGYHPAGGRATRRRSHHGTGRPRCKVKAAGGIKTLLQAIAMIDAGATRIGASASVQILKELEQTDAPVP